MNDWIMLSELNWLHFCLFPSFMHAVNNNFWIINLYFGSIGKSEFCYKGT